LRWDASNALLGDSGHARLALDWGANAGLLFGRQASEGFHQSWHCTVNKAGVFAAGCQPPTYSDPETFARSKNVTVPNLGGYAGVSLDYKHAKLKLGYRADWFFGAKDGGEAARQEVDRGFYGPYASISIGLGD
jgi:hypothetical protein